MISVFLTSIRPHRWERFYDSCDQATSRQFEIVVTGPTDSTFERPPNMKFVQTCVKPAQALEAAARLCSGEYLLQSCDDLSFTPGAFDLMVDALKEPKTIASCVYWVHGYNHLCAHTEGIFGNEGGFPKKASNNPVAPICPMLRAVDWQSAHGTDPLFSAQLGDLDLCFRLIVQGWKTVLVDGRVTEDSEGSDLWRTKGQADLTVLRSLWRAPDGDWTTERRGVVGEYRNENILTVNQGAVR